MNAFDATLLVNTHEGVFPAGTQLSYEDMANPRRFCVIMGYYTTPWGKEAVIAWEDGDCSIVSVHAICDAETNKHGWQLVKGGG